MNEGKYPLGLMGIEMQFGHNKLKKRTDILVHDRLGKPVMIVECKAPEVHLVDEVFEQIATYNLKYQGSLSCCNKRNDTIMPANSMMILQAGNTFL